MSPEQAKEILLLYRPGTRDEEEPQIAEALQLVDHDSGLRDWFTQHQAFQRGVRAKLRAIPAPDSIKHAILAQQRVVRPSFDFWRRSVWVAAAAIFVVLLGLSFVWIRPVVPDRFAHYRASMVTSAVRMYGMDLVTKDPTQLRQFVAGKGAPADYDLTGGLAKLQLKGGGLLRWRGHPVSMVCFERGPGDTLFLFVLKRSALRDPPPASSDKAALEQVDGLMTASWTNGSNTYVLAGPPEPDFASKYLSNH